MRRRLLVLVALLALPLLLVAAVYAALPILLTRIAVWQLEEHGVAVESLSIDRPTLHHVQAGNVHLRHNGTTLNVSRLEVRYRPGELWQGRVRSVTVGRAEVRLSGGGGGPTAVPLFRPPEEWPVGRLDLEGVDVFRGAAPEPVWQVRGEARTAGPRIDGRFTVRGLAAEPVRIRLRTDAEGAVAFGVSETGAERPVLQGRLRSGRERVGLELTLQGELRNLAELGAPWLAGRRLPQGWSGRTRVEASVEAPADAPDTLLRRGEGRAQVHLELVAGEAWGGTADAELALESGELRWRIEPDGKAWLRVPDGAVPPPLGEAVARVADRRVRVAVGEALHGALPLAEGTFPPERLAATGRLDARFGGQKAPLGLAVQARDPELVLAKGGLRLNAGVRGSGHWEGGPLPWRRIAVEADGRLRAGPEATRLDLHAGTRADLSGGGPEVWRGTVSATLQEPAGLVVGQGAVAAGGPVALTVDGPPLSGADWRVEPGPVRVRLATLRKEGDAWTAVGSAGLALKNGRAAGRPLPEGHLEADFRAAAGEPVTSDVRWRSDRGGLAVDGKVRHALADGSGEAAFSLQPLKLGPENERLGARIPGWDYPFDLTGGELSAKGDVSWGDEGVQAAVDAALADGAGLAGTVAFEGLEAQAPLRWDGEGLRTARPVPVRVALVRAGVPIEDVTLQAALRPGPEVALRGVRAQLLGGAARTDAVTWAPGRTGRFVVEVDGVEMARLVALEQREGLEAEGTLDGRLPVRFGPEGVSVEAGDLWARPPGGVIRYRPPGGADAMASAHPQMELVMNALADLRYDSLEADVDYAPDGTLELAVALKGRNPEVSKERPIHLNLNIEENIPALLRSLRMAREVGGRLEKGILKRLQKE